MSGLPFDPRDPRFHGWFVALNVAFDDVDAIAEDMLRPLRRRELGPAKHREMYKEGRDKLMSLLARDLPEPPEPEGQPPQH